MRESCSRVNICPRNIEIKGTFSALQPTGSIELFRLVLLRIVSTMALHPGYFLDNGQGLGLWEGRQMFHGDIVRALASDQYS